MPWYKTFKSGFREKGLGTCPSSLDSDQKVMVHDIKVWKQTEKVLYKSFLLRKQAEKAFGLTFWHKNSSGRPPSSVFFSENRPKRFLARRFFSENAEKRSCTCHVWSGSRKKGLVHVMFFWKQKKSPVQKVFSSNGVGADRYFFSF